MYRIKSQGYGGSGPSNPDIIVSGKEQAEREITDLIEADHSVKLYRIHADGSESKVPFNYFTTITVDIKDE